MGGIIGALIGRHLAHSEQARQHGFETIHNVISSFLANPYGPISNEDVDNAMEAGNKLGYYDKHFAAYTQPLIDSAKKKREAAQNLETVNKTNGNGPGGPQAGQAGNLGVPNPSPGTVPAAAPPPAPPAPPPTPPPGMPVPPPGPPQASMMGSQPPRSAFNPNSILSAVLPMLAQQQQAPPPNVPAAPPPGVPPVPFGNGAGAGPVPPADIPAPMAASAAKGGSGFSPTVNATSPTPGAPAPVAAPVAPPMPVMPPAAGPVAPPPSASPVAMPPMPPPEIRSGFWQPSRNPIDVATLKGRMGAAEALPGQLQSNTLALGQSLATSQQAFKEKLAEQQQMIAMIKTDPQLSKLYNSLNPVQQGEMVMRFMGFPGMLSNYVRPINLPKSQIHGPDTPIDAVGPDGNPIDRSPGKAYNQQQDLVSGDIRYIPTTPLPKFIKVTHGDGTTSEATANPYTGMMQSSDPRLNGITISALPKTSSAFMKMDNGDGSYSLVPITKTSGPILPGNAAPSGAPAGGLPAPPSGGPTAGGPSGPAPAKPANGAPAGGGPIARPGSAKVGAPIPFGARSIPPGQRITFETKDQVFQNTIDLVKSVQSKMHLLNSLIDAKKIELQIDPEQGIVKSIVNRNVSLTPEEAQLAGDFGSLTEHINTLRGPLGAAGFRGPEAFNALQMQRGKLTANPDVTKVILNNTLKALMGQHNAIRNGLDKGAKIPGALHDMETPEKKIDNPPKVNRPMSDYENK